MRAMGLAIGLHIDRRVGKLLLDGVSNIHSVYSMRQLLSSSIPVKLVRIRRVSDDTEQDFFARSDGDLDTASIDIFLTATTGVIVTWYDQSDANLDLVQTTAAQQPNYDDDVIGSRPGIVFDGTDDVYLGRGGDPILEDVSNHTLNVVLQGATPLSGTTWYTEGRTSSASPRYAHEAPTDGISFIRIRLDDNTTVEANKYNGNVLVFDGTPVVLTFTDANGTLRQRINGTDDGSSNSYPTGGTRTFDITTIGLRRTGSVLSDEWIGDIGEMICLIDIPSTDILDVIENSQISYWGIT